MSTATSSAQGLGFQEAMQKFGRFLSGMVLPNIGAFIAWGFLTALFIPTGWLPNEYLAQVGGPMRCSCLQTSRRCGRYDCHGGCYRRCRHSHVPGRHDYGPAGWLLDEEI